MGFPRVFTDEFGVTPRAAGVTETDPRDDEGNTFEGVFPTKPWIEWRGALGTQRDGAAHGYKSPRAGGAIQDDAGLPPRRSAQTELINDEIVDVLHDGRRFDL